MARRKRKDALQGLPLHVSARAQRRYAAALKSLTAQMNAATIRELTPKRTAMDERSETTLTRLLRRFETMFARRAPKIIADMMKDIDANSAQQVGKSLRELSGGLKIRPNADTVARMQEAAAENVKLIKSIPEKHFARVQTSIIKSQTEGLDLGLALQTISGMSERRAENIALDQTRKLFNSLNTQRMQTAGVTKGEWIHSAGSLQPRPLHVDFDGQEFDLAEGAPIGDDGGNVMPGEEPNCKCTFRPIISFDTGD